MDFTMRWRAGCCMRKLLRLFWEFFKISLFVVGGGFAIISVADDVCSRLGWTEEGELIGVLPVFQMVPGLIAGNTAIYVGNKVAGKTGAAVALCGVILPSLAIFLAVSMGYAAIPLGNPWLESCFTGLRAALTGIIAAVIWRGWDASVRGVFGYATVIACASILVLHVVDPVFVLMAAALCGLGRQRAIGTFKSSTIPAIILLFLKYGTAAFGGGYVLVPFYMADFVGPAAPYLQIAADEFGNIMALTQMTPGPISVNCATFFGYRMGGILGAGVATVALLMPSYILLLAVLGAMERFKTSKTLAGIMSGLKPASMAMMICALISFANFSIFRYNITSILIVIGVFALQTRRKMKPMTIIMLAALFATAVRADDITTETYPDTDAVVTNQIEYTRYNPDGTFTTEIETYVKVLTEKGRREESIISISYNLRYGDAEILYVGVTGSDGVERDIDFRKTMKEASDNSSMADNIYDSMSRKLVCSIPDVKIGDIIHLKYRRTIVKSRIENQFASISITEWECPILDTTIIVDAPQERPLKKIMVRDALKDHLVFSQEEKDGRIIYKWTTAYAAQKTYADPDMPPLYTQVERIHYSTAESWEEISRWYWEISAPHLAKTTEAMTNKVDEVGHDIAKLYKWVAQEIRYMGLTMEDKSPGYAPHDIDITFNNRYGVCRDKAGLLVAMLRIAGFEAYPVLIHNGAKQDPDVPMPYFNHAIVAVKKDGEIILMDPTDESSRDLMPSYLSDKSYLIATPEGDPLRTSPVVSPRENSLVIESHGLLESSGAILLDTKIAFNGINDNAFRSGLVRKNKTEQQNLFQRIFRDRYPGAEMMKCEISPADLQDTSVPLTVEIVARIPDMVIRGETRNELSLPLFSRSFGTVNWLLNGRIGLEKRRYPLVIDTTASVEEHVSVQIAGVLGDVENFPEPIAIEEPYEYSRKFHCEGDMIVADTKMSIGKVEFSPEEYGRIREVQKQIEASLRDRVIFGKNRIYDANVRYRYISEETTFTGDRSWVTTNTCVKEILTYNGKKSSSELQFVYNPSWKNIEVISACVSNRNGSVAWLDKDKEINVMDVSWAAEAPRYPATKTMVVNLPSVEIGSTIYYTTVTTVENSPVEYYGEWYFDAADPVDELYVRCGDWERRVVNPKRFVREPMLADGTLWRDVVTISSNSFTRQCATLAPALEIDPFEFSAAGETVESIRNWMVKNVRVIGPEMYEIPLAAELTAPEIVIKEGYANRLDYIRTMIALLRGAGFEADIVFATVNGAKSEAQKHRHKFEYPDVGRFNVPVALVTFDKTPMWKKILTLGLCDRNLEVVYIAFENEWTPIGAATYDGSTFFNPADNTFCTITGMAAYSGWTSYSNKMKINPDGSVDMTVESKVAGTAVGAFRKQFEEMLPDDRKRHYQTILSSLSSAATSTAPLVTDTTNYPAVKSFSCHVPDYATVDGDAITVAIPDFDAQIFPLSEPARFNPIGVPAHGRATIVYSFEFPEGYTVPECLPSPYRFSDPETGTGVWYENFVTTEMKDGRLVVNVWREEWGHVETKLDKNYYSLLKDWSRIGSSRANRTISVRKAK